MSLSYWIFVNSLWEKNKDNLKKHCRAHNFLKITTSQRILKSPSKKKFLKSSVNIKFTLYFSSQRQLPENEIIHICGLGASVGYEHFKRVFNTPRLKSQIWIISFSGSVRFAYSKPKFILPEPELLFLPYMGEVLLGFLQNHLHLSYSQGKRLTYEVVLLLCYLMWEQSIYLFHLLHGFLIF